MRAQTATTAADRRFDVGAFTRSARGDLLEGIDLDAVTVPAHCAESLAALSALEGATMAHLRNVLVTATHKDARVTAFLVTWAYEKYWIADALSTVSRTAVGPATGSLPGGPVRRSLAGFLAGTSIVAVHTTAGLIDDLVLDAAYDALATDAVGAFAELLALVRDTKARHTEFFADESRRRLAANDRAVRLTARSIRASAWPIGSPLLGEDARRRFSDRVFGGERGARRAADIGREIGMLPGIPQRTASQLARSLTGPTSRTGA
ncbi:hypothetical protein [Humibacter ginsenosidimutans]|uniref:Ferritin-like domain-containing protein n=1 Tax=Humibacter ginsenosidimutans TaxID=2599293 RepID=A0A5B8M096_9MICO|nr:hypothetical protein [Humibacter ginsenosidimutans]QDZ13429.1 hypothetical protein FPZ11_00125 [Humibacter ginsenosidimutans]